MAEETQLWVASSNSGKIAEFRVLMEGWFSQFFSQRDLSSYQAPVENGASFKDNALIKARSLAALKSDHWVVADDSGLCVSGLDGLPGIHSARYAGDRASSSENVAKLLKMMRLRGVTDRSAWFDIILCVMRPRQKQSPWFFEDRLEGRIADKPHGDSGFGYDSVFVPVGESQTLASLGLAFKNRCSHRALAVAKWKERMHEESVTPCKV